MVALTAGACGLLGGGSDVPVVLQPTPVTGPRATLVPPATPEPPPEATPTTVAEPLFTSEQAEDIVFGHVRSCADQVSTEVAPVEAVFESVYDSTAVEWQVTVSSKDKTLSFGTWRVNDNNGVVTPRDAIAGSIDSPSIICGLPVSQIAGSPTPPLIILPAPIPVVVPGILVGSSELAAHIIWSRVYSCYDHFPERDSFSAIQDENGNWVVEGRSSPLEEEDRSVVFYYGLWRVNAESGQDFALNFESNRAAIACSARNAGTRIVTSDAIPLDVASLLVWSAVYDCFNPRPEFSAFTVRRESSERAIVEGRGDIIVTTTSERLVGGEILFTVEESIENVFYGLWFVDADTSEITPWDSLAKTTAARSCFQVPTN